MADELAPWFLGANAENDEFFEKAVLELFRDHVFWRRNFHPEDPPPITTREQHQPVFLDALARTRHELHQLTAQLKRSVPFFHPRYLGHMVSDLLLPGLLAQLTTTLYNPNNVVTNTAPVTVRLELEVGKQLARMLGFDARALGHLTSGGTLANDEGLWLARAVKLFPLAARDACEVVGRFPVAELKADDVELLSWNTERTLVLLDALSKDDEVLAAASARRVEQLGLAQFAAKHPAMLDLAVLAPGTAHYSWTKAMKLLGLGARQLLEVPTVQARLDAAALEELLATRAKRRLPTLAVVGVYGTTEFGTLDPIHELAALRGKHGFWLHVDAAWGGYLPSLFRDASGALRPREEVAREFKYFPSERVHRSTEALAQADSVTVDPHKLGFVPFGAGAFLARDARVFRFAQQDAAYVFDRESPELQLGRFSLEGSRPGGPAAACYVNHRVLPLDSANFGRLIARSVTTCEALYERFQALAKRVPALAVCVPFEPDCNLVCLAFNRRGNRSLRAANAFARTVYEQMAVHPELPVQSSRFIGSSTTVELSHLGAAELARLSSELDLELQQADDTGLFMLRHTLMNPWLMSPAASAPTHLDAYVDFLERLLTRS